MIGHIHSHHDLGVLGQLELTSKGCSKRLAKRPKKSILNFSTINIHQSSKQHQYLQNDLGNKTCKTSKPRVLLLHPKSWSINLTSHPISWCFFRDVEVNHPASPLSTTSTRGSMPSVRRMYFILPDARKYK